MLSKRSVEIIVGFFMLAGMLALLVLAFRVSNISQYSRHNTFRVVSFFDNVGDLKVRAPVTISGVRVGEVRSIGLDPKTLRAKVVLAIDKKEDNLPADTSAKILTAGLIGANYISLAPGFEEENLKDGGQILETQSALVLENLIGQFIYRLDSKDKDKKA